MQPMSEPNADLRRPPLLMLVAVTALGPLALNIIMPSMPGLPGEFGTSYATVQLTLSLYLVGFAVAQLVYGPLSDRFGRRPVLLVGLALYAGSSVLAALAPTIELLILARILQAVGGCAGMVLGRAIVRDLYDRDRAASMIGYVTMGMVVAPMLAPFLGGVLDDWLGWRAVFAVTAVVGGAVLLVGLTTLHETNHQPQPLPGLGGMIAGYRRLLGNALFRAYTYQITFSVAAFFAFLGGAPYVVIELMGYPPSVYGAYFALNAFGYMCGNFLAGRYSQRVGGDAMIAWGIGLSLVGVSFMLLSALIAPMSALGLFGPMFLFSVGNGLVMPNGMAGAVSVDPRLAGTASGFSGFFQMGVGAIGSALAGVLVVTSPVPLPLLMLGSLLLAALTYVTCLVPARRAARKAEEAAAG